MPLPRLPQPDEACLHVHAPTGQIGPITRRQLAEKVASKQIAPNAHFWFEGLADWLVLANEPTLLQDLGEPVRTTDGMRPGESEDDFQERMFGALIKESWNYLSEHAFADCIDEVFLGAVITSTLDADHNLIDLSSDGSHHFLRFEHADKSRIVFRLTHLTPSLATAKVLGQRGSVVIGYGERIANVGPILTAMRSEMQSGFIQNAEPGTITVDGDISTGYVYCQVDMYWKLDDYVKPDYSIEYALLTSHIKATVHSLRKYLRGRFK